jgi:hypothetical protein
MITFDSIIVADHSKICLKNISLIVSYFPALSREINQNVPLSNIDVSLAFVILFSPP